MYRIAIINGKKWRKGKDGKKILLPHLVLSGYFLKNAGISQGDEVKIQSRKGVVTVELIKKVEDNQEKVEENANG